MVDIYDTDFLLVDSHDVVELTIIDCSGKTINNDILTKLADGCSLVLAGLKSEGDNHITTTQ